MGPTSADKPDVRKLVERGVGIRVADIGGSVHELADGLAGIDIQISAIDAMGQLAEIQLASAVKQAGVKRFVPCAYITVAPHSGVMILRCYYSNLSSQKEELQKVYQHVRKLYVPYTIIDGLLAPIVISDALLWPCQLRVLSYCEREDPRGRNGTDDPHRPGLCRVVSMEWWRAAEPLRAPPVRDDHVWSPAHHVCGFCCAPGRVLRIRKLGWAAGRV